MTGDFDYATFLENRRKDAMECFRSPAFESFESSYGEDIPSSLRRLHTLGDALIGTPLSVQFGNGTLDIQCFVPITPETIAVGERYDWKFFEFAVGSNNESLLFPIRDSGFLFVDHEGNGTDVEMTTIELDSLLTKVEEALQT